MWGSRDPTNILLESDCSYHESCEDPYTHHPIPRPIHTNRYFLEGHGSIHMHESTSPRDSRRPHSTPNQSSIRKISCPAGPYHGQCSEQCFEKDNHARPVQPVEYDGKLTQGAANDIHTNHGAPQGDYHKQFRQEIANNVHGKSRIGTLVDDGSWQDFENTRCWNNENRYSRDKPEGTSFSCNDCMEPQCPYCWRKLREAKGDFSFLDGFETQEQKWKLGKRHVDKLSNFYTAHNSPRSTLLEDRLHPEIHKQTPNPCQSSCPLEEPKWKPTNIVQENVHQNASCDPPARENQWSWPLRKGRGMGPVPGEWVPPFRKFSSEYPAETFHRSKGLGALPNLDDWVPPFRGEEQPYSWHRCKGSGGCPPQDQWHAPWSDSIRNKPADQVHSGR